MRSKVTTHWMVLASILALFTGCGGDDKPKTNVTACTPGTPQGCGNNQVCEETTTGNAACYDPIRLEGTVSDALDGAAIEGALVVARDANGAAVSGTAATNAEGHYSLLVPVKRDANGNPAPNTFYTLRADASGYQTFPTSPRVALPVSMAQPTAGVVKTTATDLALLPLPSQTSPTGIITGKVQLDNPKGTLVVAGTSTALASSDGTFTLFNVPAGAVTVTGYRQGYNLAPASVTVSADATTGDVTLAATAAPAVTVSGKVSIVNPGDGEDTSVILVVASTFVQNAARGEAPPGLRVGNVSGSFSIAGVPDGEYYVLAAFENDFLVRDPDTCIGGTAIVSVTVAGQDVAISEGFKITGSLDVVSPDAEQVVSGTPSFVWVDDSGEDHYTLAVYDAFGTLMWENLAVPSVSGAKTVTVQYGGPALTPGMVYQYRAASIKSGNCPISRTEDLRGVFRVD